MTVGQNTMAISNLDTTVGDNTDRIVILENKTTQNMMAIMNAETDFGILEGKVETLENAALIEDYFEVNSEPLIVPEQMFYDLVPAFCIEGSTVLDFRLAVNLFAPAGSQLLTNFIVQLRIDGDVVATG